eukprot:6981082-Pyramimonas_sp.AAC.1
MYQALCHSACTGDPGLGRRGQLWPGTNVLLCRGLEVSASRVGGAFLTSLLPASAPKRYLQASVLYLRRVDLEERLC